MRKNVIVTTDHETTSRLPKAKTSKYGPEKINEGRSRSKSESSKLLALQEALQDPIIVCEGS